MTVNILGKITDNYKTILNNECIEFIEELNLRFNDNRI